MSIAEAMTDEEFERHMLEMEDEEPLQEEPSGDIEDDEEDEQEEEVETSEDTQSEDETEEVDDTTEEEDTLSDEDTDENEDEDEVEESQEEAEDEEESDDEEDGEASQESSSDEETDYKAFYESVTSDYKANGKMMPGIKNPEDLRRALSMASNYALKTTALKPHMKRAKMLEGIDDDQLNEMLDFHNRDPEVIKKALKDAEIDPMELDMDDVKYRPNDYRLSDREVEISSVIDDIRDTPEFGTVQEVVSSWDEASKEAFTDTPSLLKGLHEEIALGRFEKVMPLVEQQKMLGKADGKSDLELYSQIVTEMVQRESATPAKQSEAKPAPKKETAKVAKSVKEKAAIKPKKKTKSNAKKYDPTKYSDEEFMKMVEDGATFL